MLFRQLFDRESYTYSYLLAAEGGTEAVIIDPVKEEVPKYLQLLDELGLTLRWVLDTHVHADHVTGSGALRDATGCGIAMSSLSKAQGITRHLADAEVLDVDGLKIKTLHTPGHTTCSASFLVEAAGMVFTGDTLFIRGSGRTDFQSGDAEAAYQSIFGKLLTFPDETLVYPGHDYRGWTVSTIGEERQHNPRLQVGSVAEYVAMMDELNLDPPKLIDVAVPANLICGR